MRWIRGRRLGPCSADRRTGSPVVGGIPNVHAMQSGTPDRAPGVPLAVYVLALGTFCMGMSEFMIAGLLPDIAADLDVSIPSVGTLISAFAVGMVLGAPSMAAASVRLPRRTTLIVALTVFTLAHALGALAPTYEVLLVARIAAAVACGTFWAVGTLIAVDLVPSDARGPALAVMVGGLTVANVVGVPAGTLVGELLGWRATFWAVGGLVLISLVGVLRLVPHLPPVTDRPSLGLEARDLLQPRAVIALLITATSQAAVFGAFSYIAPLPTRRHGHRSHARAGRACAVRPRQPRGRRRRRTIRRPPSAQDHRRGRHR